MKFFKWLKNYLNESLSDSNYDDWYQALDNELIEKEYQRQKEFNLKEATKLADLLYGDKS